MHFIYVGERYVFACIFGIFEGGNVGLDLSSYVFHWSKTFLDVVRIF